MHDISALNPLLCLKGILAVFV